jgi:hypothetical protein
MKQKLNKVSRVYKGQECLAILAIARTCVIQNNTQQNNKGEQP